GSSLVLLWRYEPAATRVEYLRLQLLLPALPITPALNNHAGRWPLLLHARAIQLGSSLGDRRMPGTTSTQDTHRPHVRRGPSHRLLPGLDLGIRLYTPALC